MRTISPISCFISMLLLGGSLFGADANPQQASRMLKTSAGAEFVISADGLSSIRLGGRELARGEWTLLAAENWFKEFKDAPRKVRIDKPGARTLSAGANGALDVRQESGDVLCHYTYALDGEDLLITARLENNNAELALNVAGFSGLMFNFDQKPQGLMQTQHVSYFQAHGVGLCHPSHWARIGGSWATDSSAGVGLSPWNTGMTRTLILWDYADWTPAKRETDPRRKLLYFVVQPIPPRGAATIELKLRAGPSRDWKHLLAPYREHFQKTFAPVQYKADPRWIATDYLNHSQKAVSPSNPYGFHGGHRRIDTEDGAGKFCETIIPPLKDNGGQGVIVWGQGGDDPRGGMYRPDFDILPPEVEAQWPAIARRFADAGLKLGVTTRPRDMAVKLNWREDQIISINPDDPGHRAMLWKRFDNMIRKGCTLFYLDSFGTSLEDVKLMQFLRQKMGPDILTFAEHQCDAILPYSGGYSETSYHGPEGDKPARYRLWSGLDNWEVYQWLVPGCQMASRLYEAKAKPPEALAGGPDEFFHKNGITTLLPVNDLKRARILGEIQRK